MADLLAGAHASTGASASAVALSGLSGSGVVALHKMANTKSGHFEGK